MGVSVLILGHSGSGKSTSLRNFEPDEVGVFSAWGKRLPFRKKLPLYKKPSYQKIIDTLDANNKKAYVIDDANYIIARENFRFATESGYSKFTIMAKNFETLLEKVMDIDDDTIVYFLMHPDYYQNGSMKPKTIGNMLDNQLCVEGTFDVTLIARKVDGKYVFDTVGDDNECVKGVGGFDEEEPMFSERFIPNDLKAVDSIIREYWGMAPLGGEPHAEPTD